MASHAADCSTTKPVAVVVPCHRLTDDSEPATAESLTASGQASRCDDVTATEHGRHRAQAMSVPPGHEKVSDDLHLCSESAGDAAGWLNEVAVGQRTSTCTVRPSRRMVQLDDSDVTSCPYYHGNITSDEAKRRLAGKSVGTYLLRDSQSASFPFSLSVRTSGRSGVTSLRIARDGNYFRLDCDEAHRSTMPKFVSVQRLLRHFVAESDGGEGGRCVLVGSSETAENENPLNLRQPLHRTDAVN